MKKRFFSLFVCAALLLSIVFSAHTAWADTSSNGGGTYTDPETGATFIVPEGWEEYEPEEEIPDIDAVNHIILRNSSSSIIYGGRDIWNDMSAFEHLIYNRSEINNSYAYMSKTFQSMVLSPYERHGFDVTADDIRLVTYGKTEYIELTATQKVQGWNNTLTSVWHIENGYACFFIYTSLNDENAKDFQSVLYSFQVPPVRESDLGGDSNPAFSTLLSLGRKLCLFIVELLLTFLIYALPFVVYRNAIRKRPVSKKILLIIFIVLYEFVAWILLNGAMSWFLRRYANIFIPFFWGWYSYRKMVRRKDTDAVPEDMGGSAAPQQPVKADAPRTAAYARPQDVSAALAHPFNADTPAAQQPAAYVPAASMPVPSAPSASQTPSAAPTVPASSAPTAYIPTAPASAASVPATSAPQTPPSPAAYIPTPAATQTPPAAQRGPSVSSADPASMWPAQYHSAQDMRAGFPKKGEKAPAASPVPDAPFIPAAAAPQTPPSTAAYAPTPAAPSAPAAYIPTATVSAAPAPQTPPSQAVYRSAPAAPQTPSSPAAYAPVSGAAHTSASATPQTLSAPRVQFCRNCGFRLLDGSKFCSCCGSPVVPAAKE